jgi:betaine-homocysteine S-methyltransferase
VLALSNGCVEGEQLTSTIVRLMQEQAPVLGDGGYLIELERRGYVDSGSGREKVGTGRGSGQFTPEVVVENPDALRELHREFLSSGSRVLQALTFFATREKLSRAGYGNETEAINVVAVRLAKDVADGKALVAGSVSRTQLFEREGPGASGHVRDLFQEQIRLLKDAGVDFLILETFFHLQEMRIALECARTSGLEVLATMSFRPTLAASSDGYSPEQCAKQMADAGAAAVGANCEQEPARLVPLVQAMGAAAGVPIAAQPAAFRTSDETPCFTKMPQFPDQLETIQVARGEFQDFGRLAAENGFGFIGGCCGCNAAYIRAMATGIGLVQRAALRG